MRSVLTRAALIIPLACLPFVDLVGQPGIDVAFGILVSAGDGRAEFVETTRVPNVIGQAYGWVATIAPRPTPFQWFEELRLPTAPREWDSAAAVSVDRTMAQSRGVVPANAGEFSNFWVVTAGDPNGRYSLVVKVSDGVVADFAFDVVAAN